LLSIATYQSIVGAALGKYHGEKLMINSITAEPERLTLIGSLAIERRASLVALAMGTNEIPDSVEEWLVACDQIMIELTRLGLEMKQIFFDSLVLPIATDTRQGMVTLKTLEQIKSRYPDAKTVLGRFFRKCLGC